MPKSKKAEKIKYFGVSNFTIDQIEVIEKFVNVDVLEPEYSLIFRDRLEIMQYCEKRGKAVMVYGGLAGGLLTGKIQRDSKI